MGMSDKICIRLQAFVRAAGSVYRKGNRIAFIRHEPERKMGFETPPRISLAKNQYSHVNKLPWHGDQDLLA
jgi:hypothetical protein